MNSQSLTLPSLPENHITRLGSLHTLKFKKLSQKQEIQTERNPEKKIAALKKSKLSQTSQTKRNNSCISLSNSLQKKQQKRQRLLLNILEKKIREGRYDQNEEVGTDLNSLKIQHSDFSTKASLMEAEIIKLQQRTHDIRDQKYRISCNQDELNKRFEKIKQQAEAMRAKCQLIQYEKAVNSNILCNIMDDLIIIQSRVNNLKQQIRKKKLNQSMLQKKQIQFFDREKQTERQCRNLRKNHLIQGKKMQQLLMERQKSIQLRAGSEIERQRRKKQLIQISQSVVLTDAKKAFDKLSHQILAGRLLSTVISQKFDRLMEQNQRMVRLFNQASNMYGPLTPQQYPKRFFNSLPQRGEIEQNIKGLQKTQKQQEKKNMKMQQRLSQLQNECLQMGILLQKEQNNILASKVENKIVNQKASQKLNNIRIWIDTSVSKVCVSNMEKGVMAEDQQSKLKYIIKLLWEDLLQKKDVDIK